MSGSTFATDSFDGSVAHLNAHDVTFVCASRSPLETLNAYKRRMGWNLPWVSSGSTDFNRDFSAFTEEDREAGIINFGMGREGVDVVNGEELMALSVFVLADGGVVYHTYTCYDRGTDALNTTWGLLDRTPKGRSGLAAPPRRVCIRGRGSLTAALDAPAEIEVTHDNQRYVDPRTTNGGLPPTDRPFQR